MHALLKKLLVLNGYMDEAGGAGDPGNGGQPGAGGDAGGAGGASGELETGGESGGATPGSEQPGGEGGGAEPPAGAAGAEPPAGGEAKPDAAAKRYSDLTRQLKESQAQQQRSQQQLDAALQALDRVTGGLKKDEPAPAPKPEAEEELVPPEFVDLEQYQRDMAVYTGKVAERSAKAALKAAEADRERERITAEQEANKKQVAEAWNSRRTAAMQKYEDYSEVAESPDVPISAAGAMVITSLEHGPEVAYYLGQHIDEARKIAAMPPILQAVELGKLEARITAPKPPAMSKAPEPIKPNQPNGGAAQVRGDDELSMEEYAAKRNGKR